MPSNPSYATQGGDVDGQEATDPNGGLTISPLMVSKASYDPGYEYGHIMTELGFTKAELKVGYASYGRRKVGES